MEEDNSANPIEIRKQIYMKKKIYVEMQYNNNLHTNLNI